LRPCRSNSVERKPSCWRDRLQQQVKELDKEINRTESREFKRALQSDDRTMERILGRLTDALEERRE
jgi:hypothetical protein